MSHHADRWHDLNAMRSAQVAFDNQCDPRCEDEDETDDDDDPDDCQLCGIPLGDTPHRCAE